MPKLKPCPFCGGKAEFISDFDHPVTATSRMHCQIAYVKCLNCISESRIFDSCSGETEQNAIDAWNTRSEKEYKKYDFCRSVDCDHFYPTNRFEKENCNASWNSTCPYSAKELHQWLKTNGYQIVKKD